MAKLSIFLYDVLDHLYYLDPAVTALLRGGGGCHRMFTQVDFMVSFLELEFSPWSSLTQNGASSQKQSWLGFTSYFPDGHLGWFHNLS